MNNQKSFIEYIKIWVFLLVATIVIVLSGVDLLLRYTDFKTSSERIRTDYITQQKNMIRQEVFQATDLIRHDYEQAEKLIKDKIKLRINEAYVIATHIYNFNKDKKTKAEIQEMIIETLRPLKFDNGNGYYFANKMDGINVLFADKPNFEGTDMLNFHDSNGKYIIQEMIQTASEHGEGFCEYFWTKPNSVGDHHKKISFIKLFEPLGFYIGTGLYVENVQTEVKNNLLSTISRIRFGEEGYVFVFTQDGNSLVTGGKRFSGEKKVWEEFPDNPTQARDMFDKMYKAAMTPQGDYIYYSWRKLSCNKNESPKTSFIYGLPEQQWIIGSGMYLDDIDKTIVVMQQELSETIQKRILYGLGITLFIMLIAYFLFSKFSLRLKNDIELFTSFFQHAAESNHLIDRDLVQFKEHDEMAENANTMLIKLKKAEEALTKTAEAKDEFLANMSHEIRTPMNGILGMTRLVLNMELGNQQYKMLSSVMYSAESLLGILNDILDFSKIEAGQLSIEYRNVNLELMLNHIMSSMSFQAEERNIYLKNISNYTHLPKYIKTDDLRVRQILVNLIGNAIKFTEIGGVSINVKQIKKDNDNIILRFTVSDTGIGIAPGETGAIFSSFSQADNSISRTFGGTGLGLTISKKLVEMMGGTIGVESTEGEGSTFCFTIEVVRGEETEEDNLLASGSILQDLKLLIVEDNKINQDLAKIIIEQDGHTCEIAANGLEGLEALSIRNFDAILMDMQMPTMDGLTTTSIIRAIESGTEKINDISVDITKKLITQLKGKHIPIIAMTANAMEKDRQKCKEAGMDAFMSKPFMPEDFHDSLNKLNMKVTQQPRVAMVKGSTTSFSEYIVNDISFAHLKNTYGLPDEKIHELLARAIKALEADLANMVDSLNNAGNTDKLQKIAHSFKGALLNLGLNDLAEHAKDIESVGSLSNEKNMETINCFIDKIQNIINQK